MSRVTIGKGTDHERSVPIPTFRAFRATYAGVIVGGAFDQFQEVIRTVARFQREYGEENPVRDTREQRRARAAQARAGLAEVEGLLADEKKLTERIERDNREEWQEADEAKRAELVDDVRRGLDERRVTLQGVIESAEKAIEDMGDQSYVEYPGIPEDWQIYATGFTKAMELMPQELEKLLGLVVISNADLERFYGDGREILDEECERLGKELLIQGELEEVITLMAESGEVIYAQLEKARTAVGRLQALYARATRRSEEKTETTTSSTASLPDSSTPSPPPTDGVEERPSSESPGVSSAPSVAA